MTHAPAAAERNTRNAAEGIKINCHKENISNCVAGMELAAGAPSAKKELSMTSSREASARRYRNQSPLNSWCDR